MSSNRGASELLWGPDAIPQQKQDVLVVCVLSLMILCVGHGYMQQKLRFTP